MSRVLQLSAPEKIQTLKDYKARFTADAVRRIHEAVIKAWPPDINVYQAIRRSPGDVSGLYIGDYGPEQIGRGIVRHSIYANKILLFDPFIYAPSVRDEFNPILNPAQYRTQTLKNVNLWFGLLPWIEAGIVEIIRAPADFDPQLNWELMQAQRQKFDENSELKRAAEESVDEFSKRHTHRLAYQQLLLGAPDSYLKQKFEELGLAKSGLTVEQFLKSIQDERDSDPNFLEPMNPKDSGEIFTMTSGASYASAVITANITGSYLFTDIAVKWKEIELDRRCHSAENKAWAPFAKAMQNAELRYLNNLHLQHALTLRKEERLESLRAFLRRVWRDSSTENQFDSQNALLLAEELGEQIRAAEEEWRKIDTDLIKMVGTSSMAPIVAAGPLIASGHAYFLAAAVAAAGALPLVASTHKRRTFPDRFPAAFFMKIEESDS